MLPRVRWHRPRAAAKLAAPSRRREPLDNISHTLAGVLLGECLARMRGGAMPLQPRRTLVVVLAAVGSNLPDLDLLDSGWHDRLDYLLHHRGYSHSVVAAALAGALLAVLARGWLHWRGHRPNARDWGVIGAIALLGPLLHLALDYGNSYGVHPWWPLDNRWRYGDSLFIVEPWLWLAGTPLLTTLRSRSARTLLALALGALVLAAAASGLARPAVALALAGTLALLAWLAARAPMSLALGCGLALWLGTIATFTMAGAYARHALRAQLPDHGLVDIVLTPLPGDPLCWEALLVRVEDEVLVGQRALLSLAPAHVPAQSCPARGAGSATTAPLTAVAARSDARLQWFGQVETPLARLRASARRDCRAAAALQFMRVPWLARVAGHEVIGDLRFDREPALGFAEIGLAQPGPCPRAVPWRAPRADVLDGVR